MLKENYLSEEDQYKAILNNEEISRIRDPELQEIRLRYWELRHKAFLDEHRIPDQELGNEFERIKAKEQAEILEYRKRKELSK